ncbi:hypothetical protein BAE44_0013325 [Dichanthelium oligosanthes]|uniref:BPM/SPOP BACK domain-containing protein n=1 Tax=Dichanthelium oligosanthes TaxID=888268 RepID=A0A1E5VKL6_9POAL|nr:hypothetical protein BAE44_0013325 [Dichanthelium oligosanthes]
MADFCHELTPDDKWETDIVDLATVDDVKSSHVGPDDSLRVKCVFRIRDATTGAAAAAAAAGGGQEMEIVVPPSNISWHLERLLLEAATELGSDVTFVLEEDSGESSSFHAHSLVLSERAPALLKEVLAAIASGDDATELTGTSRTRMAGDLLAAAERYQLVERMRPVCENLLCEVITPEGAAATLELARRHSRPELRAFCLDYMSSPGVLRAVVATEGYRDLSGEALRDMLSHIAAAASS